MLFKIVLMFTSTDKMYIPSFINFQLIILSPCQVLKPDIFDHFAH